MRWILAAALAVLCGAADASDRDDYERSAVVKLGGCTAFNIHPTGIFMTVKHCKHPERVQVGIGGRNLQAKRVYVGDDSDAPVVFATDPPDDGLPWLPVSREAPDNGDFVYSLGYPGGRWARVEGEIAGSTSMNGTQVNISSHRIGTGNSGGPLLNEQGEVIGIASAVDGNIGVHKSFWISFRETRKAYDAVVKSSGNEGWEPVPKRGDKPEVVVFTVRGCAPCMALERDYKAGHFKDYRFRFVSLSDDRDNLVAEFRSQTGKDPAYVGTPTIWVRGTKEYKVGYEPARRGGLIGWIDGALRHLGEGLFGRPKPRPSPIPEPEPRPEPVPEPEPEPEIDWSAVQIVVLAAEQDVGFIRGEVRERVLRLAVGPVRRSVAEATDGKAVLEIVAQRTSPKRYEAVAQAVGVPPEGIHVVALVKRQDAGIFIKELIRKKLLQIAERKIGESVPVEVIFERTHKADFEAIMESLKVAEDVPEPEPEAEPESPLKVVKDLAVTLAETRSLVGGLEGKLDGIAGKVATEAEPADEQQPFVLHVIAGVLSMLGFERLVSIVRRRKRKGSEE